MRNLQTSIFGMLILVSAIPAFAGPDFQAIEQARKSHRAEQVQKHEGAGVENPWALGKVACPPDRLVLPLDHGPRAATTPYMNQKRKESYDAQMKACKEG